MLLIVRTLGRRTGRSAATILIIITVMIISGVASVAESVERSGQIDMLDYMLQTDDVGNTWTLMGFDMKAADDPEGQDVVTYVGHKFSLTGAYEVFHATDQWIYNRYELARYHGAAGTDNWIRRFEEVGQYGSRLGGIWCRRYVTPGEPGCESRHAIDRFIYDNDNQEYVWDQNGSTTDSVNYISVEWADAPPNRAPDVEIKTGDTIRIVQQWHPLGLIIEMYDYAKGKGIVAWCWTERLEWIMRDRKDPSGDFYRSQYGPIVVTSAGDSEHEPEVYEYDPKTDRRGKRLSAFLIKSHWLPDSPPAWYIVMNDTLGSVVAYKKENIPVDYGLPEWQSKPGATIADLPYVNTMPIPRDGFEEPEK